MSENAGVFAMKGFGQETGCLLSLSDFPSSFQQKFLNRLPAWNGICGTSVNLLRQQRPTEEQSMYLSNNNKVIFPFKLFCRPFRIKFRIHGS